MAEIKELKLPQGTIRYRDSGTGDPLVFIHGALVNGLLWKDVTPLLERDFHCIVPDLPLGLRGRVPAIRVGHHKSFRYCASSFAFCVMNSSSVKIPWSRRAASLVSWSARSGALASKGTAATGSI